VKYEDLDSYIESLFNRPSNPNDISGFDGRLSNVEAAILDTYESAVRWHSAQIGSAGNDKSDDSLADPDNGHPYWSDCGPNG